MSVKKMLLVAHGSTVLACIIIFWIAEDFLWFVGNPLMVSRGLTLPRYCGTNTGSV